MNPWPYILGAYSLAAAGMLGYLVSVRRRTKVMTAQVAALARSGKDTAR